MRNGWLPKQAPLDQSHGAFGRGRSSPSRSGPSPGAAHHRVLIADNAYERLSSAAAVGAPESVCIASAPLRGAFRPRRTRT